MTNPIDKTALRALAEAATPGPWTYFPKPKYSEHHVSVPIAGSGWRRALFDDGCSTGAPDAQFIAAANPATIIALLEELVRTERNRDMWKEQVATQAAQIEACRAEASALVVKLMDTLVAAYPELNGLALVSDTALGLANQHAEAIVAARAWLGEAQKGDGPTPASDPQ